MLLRSCTLTHDPFRTMTCLKTGRSKSDTDAIDPLIL
jgi:hypothetical protein